GGAVGNAGKAVRAGALALSGSERKRVRCGWWSGGQRTRGLEESGHKAVGGARREGERPGEERRERAPQTSATPRRNPRRERREQRREARERTDEDPEVNDLPLLVEAHQIDGFEFHPANARAKGERSRIAERERFGGLEV